MTRLILAAVFLLSSALPGLAAEPNDYFASLQRSDAPNDWLIAPEGFPSDPDAPAPVFDVSAKRLAETFVAVAKSEGADEVTTREDGFLCVVAVTGLLGFEDDVCAQFILLEPERSTLAVYSASRVGYWDLGANRARLEDWLARIAERLR